MWGMAKINYTTVTGVPLLRVGQWMPSQGNGKVDRDLLDNLQEASQDPRLNLPVIKIGHVDDRFDNPDYFALDGEPAYGQVTNLTISEDEGGTLVGDLINIPEDLADKLPSAYPHRSVEIAFGVELLDPEGEVIETFPAVLTALALLGAAEPAVSGLGAIHESFSKGKPMTIKNTKHLETYALAGGHTYQSLREALSQLLKGAYTDDTYLWVVDLDDTTVVYEVETSSRHHTYQQGYTLDQAGAITLNGDTVEVIRHTYYRPIDADTAPVPHAAFAQDNSEGESPTTVAAPLPSHKEEDPMLTDEQIAALREKLGIGDEVTGEEIRAIVNGEQQEQAPEQEDPEQSGDEPAAETTETDTPAPAEVPEVLAASQHTGLPATVSVSAAAFAQLQTQNKDMAARLARIEAKEAAERRDKVIDAAFKSGRLHPTEKAAFREALDQDEATVTRLLESRHPAFPTTEIGSTGAAFAHGAKEVEQAQAEMDKKLFGQAGK